MRSRAAQRLTVIVGSNSLSASPTVVAPVWSMSAANRYVPVRARCIRCVVRARTFPVDAQPTSQQAAANAIQCSWGELLSVPLYHNGEVTPVAQRLESRQVKLSRPRVGACGKHGGWAIIDHVYNHVRARGCPVKLRLPSMKCALALILVLGSVASHAVPVSHIQVRIVTGMADLTAGSYLELRIYEAGRP